MKFGKFWSFLAAKQVHIHLALNLLFMSFLQSCVYRVSQKKIITWVFLEIDKTVASVTTAINQKSYVVIINTELKLLL